MGSLLCAASFGEWCGAGRGSRSGSVGWMVGSAMMTVASLLCTVGMLSMVALT